MTELRAAGFQVCEDFAGQPASATMFIPVGSRGFEAQSVNTKLFDPGAAPDEFAPAWAIVGKMEVVLAATSRSMVF